MNLSEIAINIGKRPKLIKPKFINKNFNGKTTRESIPRKK